MSFGLTHIEPEGDIIVFENVLNWFNVNNTNGSIGDDARIGLAFNNVDNVNNNVYNFHLISYYCGGSNNSAISKKKYTGQTVAKFGINES